MKITLLALSTCLYGAMATMNESRARRRLNKEFMKAMEWNLPDQKRGRKQKIKKLHEQLLKASRKLSGSSYNQYEQNAYQQSSYQGQQQQQEDGGDQQENQAYSDVGTWNGQNWEFNGEVPFDLTSRAFKYSGCAAIKSYDVSRAYETGNPMVLDIYAVFRLCPSDQCNKYSTTGCGKNYGEYAVEMKTYLSYILGFYDERFNDYCDYCEPCDWEYKANAKADLQVCYTNLEQQQYQQAEQAQQQAWQNFYNANNGDMSGWNVNSQSWNTQSWNSGDKNFQNYNNYYNQAHNYNSYYNNARTGSGANYNANYNSANGNAYGSNSNMGHYTTYNGYYRAGYGNRNLQDGYFDENGNWVDGNNGNGDNSNGNFNGYYNYGNGNANNEGDVADSNNANGSYEYVNGYWGADGNFYQTGNNNNINNYDYFDGDQEYQPQECMDGSLCVLCKDGSMCDICEAQNEELYGSCDDYICGDYYTYCSDLYGETSNFDLSQYLECTEYQDQNGNLYYIGPHCGSDHYTISLGVFSDENCLDYIGEDISLSAVLGFQHNDRDLFQFPKECISCDGTEDYEANLNSGTGLYGDYVTAPQTDAEGAVAMCRALYETSAQCNMKMKNFQQISIYMSDYEIDIEKRNCAFIENIIQGSYDDNGDILLKPDSFDFANWRNPQQYKTLRMPASQAIFLSMSIVALVATTAAAIFTQRSLTRINNPWRAKGMSQGDELIRVESGIAFLRTQSGVSAAPFI